MPIQIISLQGLGVEVIEGSIERTGAGGDLLSIYVRGPDGNLIELANQTSESGKMAQLELDKA